MTQTQRTKTQTFNMNENERSKKEKKKRMRMKDRKRNNERKKKVKQSSFSFTSRLFVFNTRTVLHNDYNMDPRGTAKCGDREGEHQRRNKESKEGRIRNKKKQQMKRVQRWRFVV